jgi:predicted Zn-dependent peptidase
MEFVHDALDNGLTIVAEVNPAAASLAVGFFVKTGSRDETPEVGGVSHFLEHMMFKGTARRTARDVNREFDEMGANYNAFTSEENTVYFAGVLPEFQDRAVDLLGDMLRPSLRAEDFEAERKVILEEIALYEDLPHFRVHEKLMASFFAGHPLGHAILGTTASIEALKREDMQGYFDRRYSPGNVTVVGVGCLDFPRFREKVAEMCGGWRAHDVSRPTPSSAGQAARTVLRDPKVLREHVAMMSPAPAAQDDRRHAARLAASIVGDSTGSRLYYALIEPALADEASTTYLPMDGAGAFYTYVSTDAEHAAEAVRVARGEFERFVADGCTEAELLAAKNKIASTATLKSELPMGRLTAVGADWVYRGEYVPLARQIERLFAVTADEVRQVARDHELSAKALLGLGPLEAL